MAAAPASQDQPANVFVNRGQVAKFATTSTFKLNLPKGDHAVLTPRGVRFLDANGQVVGGMARQDIKDTAGHIHKATWTLNGDQVTQTISDVNGSTIEGTLVQPTAPGQVSARSGGWDCIMDGAGAVAGGLGLAGAAVTSPMTLGTSLAAGGAFVGGTAAAAKGFADNCV
ncbi:hypothetical protein [Streptomyces sp. CT34]|uniref:hypothetical protein n=1 Tax=Streptomyces sp. CT34 TaxID=1553907 RepID=UPI0005BE8F4A|nr:hypothetical protein [Streptomyces sp. CT34]